MNPCVTNIQNSFDKKRLFLKISEKDKEKEKSEKSEKSEGGEEDENDEGKVSVFTLLLHGSLKVEGMVALTRVA